LTEGDRIEFAGFYVANQKGYYAEENLAATLLPKSFASTENL
jgi:hypothetical protein